MIWRKSPDFGGPRLWSRDHSPELEEWEKNWWTTEEPDRGRTTTVWAWSGRTISGEDRSPTVVARPQSEHGVQEKNQRTQLESDRGRTTTV